MPKEFIVEGAMCMCKFGASPGRLKVIDNTYFKANGNKLVATTLTQGNVIMPPGFGVCNSSYPSKPCVPAITQWSNPFKGIKTSAGSQPLTDESKGTCAVGVPQCIEFTMTGQIPVPGMNDFCEATAEHQTDLDPMGEAAGLTEHQIEFLINKL